MPKRIRTKELLKLLNWTERLIIAIINLNAIILDKPNLISINGANQRRIKDEQKIRFWSWQGKTYIKQPTWSGQYFSRKSKKLDKLSRFSRRQIPLQKIKVSVSEKSSFIWYSRLINDIRTLDWHNGVA